VELFHYFVGSLVGLLVSFFFYFLSADSLVSEMDI